MRIEFAKSTPLIEQNGDQGNTPAWNQPPELHTPLLQLLVDSGPSPAPTLQRIFS